MHQMKQIPNLFCWCLEINYFKDGILATAILVTPCIKEVLQTAATFWGRRCAWSWQQLCFRLRLQGDAASPLYGELLGTPPGSVLGKEEATSPLISLLALLDPSLPPTSFQPGSYSALQILGKIIDYVGRLYYKICIIYLCTHTHTSFPESLAIFFWFSGG